MSWDRQVQIMRDLTFCILPLLYLAVLQIYCIFSDKGPENKTLMAAITCVFLLLVGHIIGIIPGR